MISNDEQNQSLIYWPENNRIFVNLKIIIQIQDPPESLCYKYVILQEIFRSMATIETLRELSSGNLFLKYFYTLYHIFQNFIINVYVDWQQLILPKEQKSENWNV